VPRPVRVDGPGAVHHVVARGNERKEIFRDDLDREVFLTRLERAQGRFGFRMFAFCLMDNHIHLALRTGAHPLSRVLLTILSAYAGGFNRRHGRVGHLFQGRYKASLIKDDRHLLAVIRYIHRNPVEARLVTRAEHYRWSSDRAYRTGSRPVWMDTALVLGILDSDPQRAVRRYAELVDGVELSECVCAPRTPSEASAISCDAEENATNSVILRRPVESFVRVVAEKTGAPLSALGSATRKRSVTRARAMAALLARELAGIPVSRTAGYFGRDESTLAKRVSLLVAEMVEDADLRKQVDEIRNELINNAFMHG
jgi:REP element-mobilizing transposase RayT